MTVPRKHSGPARRGNAGRALEPPPARRRKLLNDDATARPAAGEDALARALAAAHDALAAKIALLETEQATGSLAPEQAAGQARAAQAAYDRDCALARIAAETGWQTWAGVGGILYARRLRSSPPMVVRAATPQALAEAIERAENGRTV